MRIALELFFLTISVVLIYAQLRYKRLITEKPLTAGDVLAAVAVPAVVDVICWFAF